MASDVAIRYSDCSDSSRTSPFVDEDRPGMVCGISIFNSYSGLWLRRRTPVGTLLAPSERRKPMWKWHSPHPAIRARTHSVRDLVVVASEDPRFWVDLRRQAPELEAAWVLARSARECLAAVEGKEVRAVILDGAMTGTPANQLLRLVRQIRPDLPVIFAFGSSGEDWEREVRQAGVLYYGDRQMPSNLVHVVRRNLRRQPRARPRARRTPDGARHED